MARKPQLGQRRPKPVSKEDWQWINQGLLHDMRNITLVTAKDPDETGRMEPHTTPLYSTITRRLSPGRRTIQVAWRSHDPESSEHSDHIERDCRAAAALGNRALARVSFSLMNSDSGDIAVKLFGLARRIEDPDEAQAALNVVNDYRYGRRREELRTLEPDSEVSDSYSMYIADIYRATATVDIQEYTADGWRYKRSGHTELDLGKLKGFDFPPRPQDPA